MKEHTDRIPQYSILRCFATFFVIIGHACSWYQLTYPVTVSYSGYAAVLSSSMESYIYSFHMPLFFFLSGAVFSLSQWEEDHIADFLKKKGKRLLVPYFLVGLLYMFPVKTIFGYFQIPDVFETVAAYPYTTQDSGYLWYLAILFGVFALYALLKSLLPEGWEKWVLTLCVFAYIFDFFYPFKAFWEISSFYFAFFLVGFFFSRLRSFFDRAAEKYPIIVFFIFLAYFYLFFFRNHGAAPQLDMIGGLYVRRVLERSYSFISALVSCLMWYLLSSMICSLFSRQIKSEFVRILDQESLAMYLIHDPLNYPLIMFITSQVWQTSSGVLTSPISFLVLLARSLGIYLLSLFLAVLIRRLPKTEKSSRVLSAVAVLIYVSSVVMTIWERHLQ